METSRCNFPLHCRRNKGIRSKSYSFFPSHWAEHRIEAGCVSLTLYIFQCLNTQLAFYRRIYREHNLSNWLLFMIRFWMLRVFSSLIRFNCFNFLLEFNILFGFKLQYSSVSVLAKSMRTFSNQFEFIISHFLVWWTEMIGSLPLSTAIMMKLA